MKSVTGIILIALIASAAAGAPFAVPAEVVPPFHRAKLPIDSDSMASLSTQLTALAHSGSLASPELRRATAQSLAIALAVDPDNSAARATLADIADGIPQPPPDAEKLARAKSGIWEMHSWLTSPDAGSDGNLVAGLIGDAASVLDAAHPTAVSLRASPERGNWDGWVAPLAAFTEKTPEPPPVVAEAIPVEPERPPKPTLAVPFKATSASIGTVLFIRNNETGKYTLTPTTVTMEAGPFPEADGDDGIDVERSGLHIEIPSSGSSVRNVNGIIAQPILEALRKTNGSNFPTGKLRLLSGPGGRYSHTLNGTDLTGPGFILANAAITGTTPGGMIIAQLGPDGALAPPDYFWRKLDALTGGGGGRLVVPPAAAEYLSAMLVLEKPDFLFKYEVLTASTTAEAIALCAKTPDEERAAIHAKFKEIKDKVGKIPLGSYLANHYVRQRLGEITAAAPYHLSARLLAIQGSGERPRILERKILAAAVFQAIDGISGFEELDIYEMNSGTSEKMEKIHEAARERLDILDRYTGIQDRDLISQGKALAASLRSLQRLVGSRGIIYDKYADMSAARNKLVAENKTLRRMLANITGDPLPEVAEARERAQRRSLIREQ